VGHPRQHRPRRPACDGGAPGCCDGRESSFLAAFGPSPRSLHITRSFRAFSACCGTHVGSPRKVGKDRKRGGRAHTTHDRARHGRHGRHRRTRSRGPRPRGSGPKWRSVPSRRVQIQHSATARHGGTHTSPVTAATRPARAAVRSASATGTCARSALPAAAYGRAGPGFLVCRTAGRGKAGPSPSGPFILCTGVGTPESSYVTCTALLTPVC
jgi:hypothetical protein